VPHYLVTAPATEPVSLAEARAHLRLEDSLDDVYVTTLIAAARRWVEERCRRGLITQTWELILDAFPDEEVELPRGPLQSITSVKYLDVDGVEQTLAPATYETDTVNDPGRLRLAYDKDWPDIRERWNSVRVRYVVGWASAAAVPEPIRQAMQLLVSQMYEHRTPEVLGTIVSKVSFAVDALLSPYVLHHL
jgi:uncharacterized phiE125 gp8 family phage protein